MQTVVTHSGSFDPDEVLAVAAVQLYLGVDEVEIIRSRQPEVIEKGDWAVDVGGIYDVATNRFDHHQNGVAPRENGVPYSAVGLVWKEYGEKICGSSTVAKIIEQQLVLPIDSADNHVPVSHSHRPEVTPFEFYDVIDSFKPVWGSEESFDTEFIRAVDFARGMLQRIIAHAKAQIECQTMIQNKYDSEEEKTIMFFEESVARHALVGYQEVKVVVSPVHASDVKGWMVATVPDAHKSFMNRAEFPESWAGLVDEELVEASGIEGAIFCHKKRYVFVAKTKEAALKAAQIAVEYAVED